MNEIEARWHSVQERIRKAERVANREEGSVRLLAVSKTQPPAAIATAYQCGQRDFGENYLQEAVAKQQALAGYDIVWHFIGPIQSNKTRLLASQFQWVHSVDRWKIAQRLSEQRPEGLPPLSICLQVNVSGEDTKSGVAITELAELASAMVGLPHVRLRGLMAIPAPSDDFERQREGFRALRVALEDLNLPGMDTLSMGMSGDLEAAILEGSTLVRIGTALFGERC